MRAFFIPVKKIAIVCHRWMGVALCLLFSWWFVSGIFMMYWDYPEVSAQDRLRHAPVLDPARVNVTPEDAWKKLELDRQPDAVRLASFDGSPAYFFRTGPGENIVYADTGEPQLEFPDALNLRTAAAWTGQDPSAARVEVVTEPDQWTVGGIFRRAGPLTRYSWADGQQVYIAQDTGEVVQYTTRSSRIFAHLGAIPHWLYYTPLRKNQPLWSRIVTWASAIATVAALLGLIVGIWMYSPSKRYRFEGVPTSIPYHGAKRLHTIFGLFFGIVACTWAFSGMLSMEPFPQAPPTRRPPVLRSARVRFSQFEARSPRQALESISPQLRVKQLDLASFDGQPVYIATQDDRHTRVIPIEGAPRDEFDRGRVAALLQKAIPEAQVSVVNRYDAYYLDRTGERPLPVLLAMLGDGTRYYVDPKTARVVGNYSPRSWLSRWLYHGLHSLNFPWLYNYRPAWDIVVLALMIGGVSLSVTSVIIGYQVLRRKLSSQE